MSVSEPFTAVRYGVEDAPRPAPLQRPGTSQWCTWDGKETVASWTPRSPWYLAYTEMQYNVHARETTGPWRRGRLLPRHALRYIVRARNTRGPRRRGRLLPRHALYRACAGHEGTAASRTPPARVPAHASAYPRRGLASKTPVSTDGYRPQVTSTLQEHLLRGAASRTPQPGDNLPVVALLPLLPPQPLLRAATGRVVRPRSS